MSVVSSITDVDYVEVSPKDYTKIEFIYHRIVAATTRGDVIRGVEIALKQCGYLKRIYMHNPSAYRHLARWWILVVRNGECQSLLGAMISGLLEQAAIKLEEF